MVSREGWGALLTDGVREAARRLGPGSEAYAVHVAGQEPGMIDPRLLPWMAVTYQLDATPARHTQGGPWCETYSDEWKDALGLTELGRGYKTSWDAQIYKRIATMLHTVNASGICQFPWYIMSPTSVPDFLSTVTGWNIDMNECFRIGERIANIRQVFNLREGFNPLNKPLPGRIVGHPPLRGGPTAGVQIDIGAMNAAYLAAMDWDTDTARPLPRKLADLGLEDTIADFW
jgi:aldehyde:ferredoxin oxidoreductase